MTIKPPVLDDRRYEDIRRELLRRIPMHTPEWTDHNPADPGVAILELFAWLTQNTLYRLNRVPERALAEYLRLLDIPVRPASPARALLEFSLSGADAGPRLLELSVFRRRPTASAGEVAFQVLDELEVLPLEAVGFVKAPGPLIQDPADPTAAAGRAVGAADLLPVVRTIWKDVQVAGLRGYLSNRLPEVPKEGLPEPTDIGAAVDKVLWIALARPEKLKAAAAASETPEAAVRSLVAGRVLSIGVRVDDELCGPLDQQRCPAPGGEARAPRVVWQVATGKLAKDGAGRPLVDKPLYRRLVVEKDSTFGLERSGVVRLRLPGVPASERGGTVAAGGADDTGMGTWTRADLPDEDLLGVGDLPPLLEDVDLEERIVTWIRCFRPDDPHPRVRWVGANVVEAEQAVTAQPEQLGRGTGHPDQEVALSHGQVVAGSLLLQVKEAGGWVSWREVDTFAGSSGADPHFVFDPESGTVRFGDGIRGRMPRLGEEIRARSYRYGGGAAGNLPAGSIARVKDVPGGGLKVTNPLPTEGGRDGETLEEAKRRIPAELRHRQRAVAAQDFRDLALQTPGPQVGRVEVLPRHKPFERVDEVPGVVTLVVLPAYDPLHPDEPVPDREMLRRVCEHLEPRRLVTTELYVTPPEYVPVWVSISFEVDPGYGFATVRRWVDLAVRQALAPLPPYGPAGEGWPFGRDVRAGDVEAAVLRVEGVRLVWQVRLEGDEIADDGTKTEVRWDGEAKAAPVHLRRWQLPVLRGVQLAQGDAANPDAEPITREGDVAAPEAPPSIPVPIEQDVC